MSTPQNPARPTAPAPARLRIERDHELAWIVLTRPEAKNALDLEMIAALHRALDELEGDRDLGCLLLRGEGSVFAAGADIGELRRRDAIDSLAGINSRLFRRLELFPTPTIAVVDGVALGGGCELALASDLRIAGRGARFGQPEVSLGIMPAAGATQRLPRLIGLGRARELVLTGRLVDADEALAIGLVNRVVESSALLESATGFAREITRQGRLATRLAKQALNAAFPNLESGLAYESTAQALLFESREKAERMDAFLARKQAQREGEK
ncbi:MAG: enoyl-CoA hydratase/isomerase family protein [Candidatus Eisenbacteria bacterium]